MGDECQVKCLSALRHICYIINYWVIKQQIKTLIIAIGLIWFIKKIVHFWCIRFILATVTVSLSNPEETRRPRNKLETGWIRGEQTGTRRQLWILCLVWWLRQFLVCSRAVLLFLGIFRLVPLVLSCSVFAITLTIFD